MSERMSEHYFTTKTDAIAYGIEPALDDASAYDLDAIFAGAFRYDADARAFTYRDDVDYWDVVAAAALTDDGAIARAVDAAINCPPRVYDESRAPARYRRATLEPWQSIEYTTAHSRYVVTRERYACIACDREEWHAGIVCEGPRGFIELIPWCGEWPGLDAALAETRAALDRYGAGDAVDVIVIDDGERWPDEWSIYARRAD